MKYCSNCGRPLHLEVPTGDDRQRHVCRHCETIHYQNPKMVVGCIPLWNEKILLCRRAIEPCVGKWTIPAGYLENGETVAEGAKREVAEEACARVHRLKPYALYNLSFVSQVYFIFLARLKTPEIGPGHESSEVGLFAEADVPWDNIAFAVVTDMLRCYYRDRRAGDFPFYVDTINPGDLPKPPIDESRDSNTPIKKVGLS